MSDHIEDIEKLRHSYNVIDLLCADLLELHDSSGLSLDNWAAARLVIEKRIGHKIQPNGV